MVELIKLMQTCVTACISDISPFLKSQLEALRTTGYPSTGSFTGRIAICRLLWIKELSLSVEVLSNTHVYLER